MPNHFEKDMKNFKKYCEITKIPEWNPSLKNREQNPSTLYNSLSKVINLRLT